MSTQTRSRAEQQEARRNFLITGARSFLQAAAAMAKFHREVYEGCRKALRNRLADLGTALAMKLDADQIVPDPAKWDWDGLDPASPQGSVGARLPITDWGNLYCYCWWRYEDDADEPVLVALASIAPTKAEIRKQWERALKSVEPTVQCDGWELWIERVLTPDAFGDLDSSLDQLLGGFAALLAKARTRLKPER